MVAGNPTGCATWAWAMKCGAAAGLYSGEEYVTKMKTFAHFVHNYNPDQAPPKVDFSAIAKDLMTGKPMDSLPSNPNGMRRIAAGPNSSDPSYTEVIMKAWKARSPIYWDIDGISLHQYTWGSLPFNEPATGFGEKEYATILMQSQWMDRTVAKHSEIMDRYDPRKHVALVVDEWGVWLKPTEGTEQMHLIQQNSLRDGIAAAMNLNIFARHADRVRMTNIAQMVNVLQAMIMTNGPKMVLTPTYHVYKMYVPFQDATFLPVTFNAGEYRFDKIVLPKVDAIAARGKDGKVWLSLSNLDPRNPAEVTVAVPGVTASRAEGEVLTAASFSTVNTDEAPRCRGPPAVQRCRQRRQADAELAAPFGHRRPPGAMMSSTSRANPWFQIKGRRSMNQPSLIALGAMAWLAAIGVADAATAERSSAGNLREWHQRRSRNLAQCLGRFRADHRLWRDAAIADRAGSQGQEGRYRAWA